MARLWGLALHYVGALERNVGSLIVGYFGLDVDFRLALATEKLEKISQLLGVDAQTGCNNLGGSDGPKITD